MLPLACPGGAVTTYKINHSGGAEPTVVTWSGAWNDDPNDIVVVAAPPDLIEPFGELLYEAGALSGP